MNAMKLDDKGRCCGRKPIAYQRNPHKFCPRCDRAYDSQTGEQIENWAWGKDGDEFYRKDALRRTKT